MHGTSKFTIFFIFLQSEVMRQTSFKILIRRQFKQILQVGDQNGENRHIFVAKIRRQHQYNLFQQTFPVAREVILT